MNSPLSNTAPAPRRGLAWRTLACSLVLLCAAQGLWAQEAGSEPELETPAEELTVAPSQAPVAEGSQGDALSVPLTTHQLRTSDPEATLLVWNRVITVFRASYRDYTPALRAELAQRRIGDITGTGGWDVRAVEATIGELSGYVITVDGAQVFGLLEEDLDPVSSPPLAEIAAAIAERLSATLEAQWQAQRLPVILRGAGFAALATLLFAILMRLLGRTASFLTNSLPRLLPKLEFSWRPWGFDLRESLAELRLFLIRLLSLAGGIALTYLWVTFVLAQFPYTEPWSGQLGSLLLGSLRSFGDGAMNAIPGLFLVFIVMSLTRMVVRLIGSFFTAVEHGTTHVAWLEAATAKATRRIVTVMVWLFALTFAYPYIPGSGTTAFKGISVFVGLLVTVGSTGLVNQVMSGLVVLYSRTLKAGDYVQIGEDEGIVTGVGFLSTRIATPLQEEIIIPNAVLTGKVTRNLSHIKTDDGVVATTSVTIGYDTPWRQVVALLLAAAQSTEHIRATPEPYVLQRSLSDFYVHYQLIFHVTSPDLRARTLSVLHQNILDGFNAAEVQIMSPHFLGQPDEPVLVPRGAAAVTRRDGE